MSKIVRGVLGGVAAAFLGGGKDQGELARLQAEQQARINAERAQLDQMNAASLKARGAGRRGLLAFADDQNLGSTFGG